MTKFIKLKLIRRTIYNVTSLVSTFHQSYVVVSVLITREARIQIIFES